MPRDVAGLSRGGTEMSMRENGDFMHLDCRNTAFGYAVYAKTARGTDEVPDDANHADPRRRRLPRLRARGELHASPG